MEEEYKVQYISSRRFFECNFLPILTDVLGCIPDWELRVPYEYQSYFDCFTQDKLLRLNRKQYEDKLERLCDKINILLQPVNIDDEVLIRLSNDINHVASPVTAYLSILTGVNIYKIDPAVFTLYSSCLFQKAIKTTRYVLDLILNRELFLYVSVVPEFLHLPFFVGETFPKVLTVLLASRDKSWLREFGRYIGIKGDVRHHPTVQVIRTDPFLFALTLCYLPCEKIQRWGLFKRFSAQLWQEETEKPNKEACCLLFFILLSKHSLDAIRYLKIYISVRTRRYISKYLKDRNAFLPTSQDIAELYNICLAESSSNSVFSSGVVDEEGDASSSFLSSWLLSSSSSSILERLPSWIIRPFSST